MGIVVRMEWMSREERDFLLVALLTGYHDAGGWVLDAGTVKDMITAIDLLHAGRLLLEAGISRGWNEYKGCHWHCYNMMVSAVVGWFSSAFSSVMERMELIRERRRVRHHIYISVLQIACLHTQRHLTIETDGAEFVISGIKQHAVRRNG